MRKLLLSSAAVALTFSACVAVASNARTVVVGPLNSQLSPGERQIEQSGIWSSNGSTDPFVIINHSNERMDVILNDNNFNLHPATVTYTCGKSSHSQTTTISNGALTFSDCSEVSIAGPDDNFVNGNYTISLVGTTKK